MTIEEMKKKKQELGYSNERLARLSGVPEATIQKIFSGTTKSPRYETIHALERALSDSTGKTAAVREGTADYLIDNNKKQGEYTIEDYRSLPDDQRAELIDGVIYLMTAPATLHQLIAGEVHYQIKAFIKQKGGKCLPFIAPVDVQLDRDERTMLQPDVLICCDADLVAPENIFGAPDFVLEVISPGTKRKDFTIKLSKYQNAGVREYWIVDPYKKMIFVYFFESETCCPGLYPIDAAVPVNIYNGELMIDLTDVLDWINKLAK
ncbi:MAG: Uma2 family endonuclease [Lachnospiraceae bacterium]|nr:Uma2 family endonuclease [Lachnospiraceae bacterium]